MNANELADIVDKWAYKESAEYLTDAANMLRQQQDEINALKEGIIKIKEGCSSVKTDDVCTKEIKELATLVIRDCNLTLRKVEK